MIAELQRKFIRISVLSILTVFTLIFLALAHFSTLQVKRTLDVLTRTVANAGSLEELAEQAGPAQGALYGGDSAFRLTTRTFLIWLDEEENLLCLDNGMPGVTESRAEELAREAAEEGRDKGWVSDYRYRRIAGEGETLYVFADGSLNRSVSNRLLFTAFLVLLGSAVLILTFTVLFSKRVLRPVADSYEKQKQFITDANHEMKTPLTLILSNLDIVESELGKSEWLDDIRSEGERMGLLINQMVTLSRMDESENQLLSARFDLTNVVTDAVAEFQPLVDERGLSLWVKLEPGLQYQGDQELIRRLVAILMDNAVKYCDPDGTIRVELFRRRHPVLLVENDYAAVDSLQLDRLFDRFYRADKARTFSGSFGVGLSIARSILRSHHGSISAYRREGIIGFRADLK